MSEPEESAGVRATPEQRFKMSILLDQICPIVRPGWCSYAEGWSDERLASEVGLASVGPAAYWRRHARGRLISKAEMKEISAVEAMSLRLDGLLVRIEQLERQVAAHQTALRSGRRINGGGPGPHNGDPNSSSHLPFPPQEPPESS
jgi:hypothetical protein